MHINMIEATGYTIWVEPTGKIFKNFKQTIKALSEEFGTPEFTPHVTILGAIEQPLEQVLKKAAKLASMLKSFEIQLTGEIICEENDWTRTMIVLAKQTPELMQAYKTAAQILGTDTDIFTPHISLMYSEDLSLGQRKNIVKQLNKKSLSGKFQVNYLILMDNDGRVEDWREVQKFALIS